jgi:spore photoproduct lyase
MLNITQLYIDADIVSDPYVSTIKDRLKVPHEVVETPQTLYHTIASSQDPVETSKQILYLTRNKGAFMRPCPGTRHYTCCGYIILHVGTFCVMDCSYCILQSYFHPPILQFYVNHADMMAELDQFLAKPFIRRIGTGEFTDSLIWEDWTDLSKRLIPKFASQHRAVLEIKTKTAAIGSLGDVAHNRKTILSWSLNTEKMIRFEERHTADLEQRLKAAKQCESWGYPLAFHFDPMIIYDGCEEDYRLVIQQLFSTVSAENIVWISLGSFRFMPSLKPIIQRRFPHSKIVYGEFIPGLDGKMRYFKPLRVGLYRKIVSWIRAQAPDVVIYFCMEDDDVWQKAIGFTPQTKGGLPRMLDDSAVRQCGLHRT